MRHEKRYNNLVALGVIFGASLGILISTFFMGGDYLALAIVAGAALGIVVTARYLT